MARGSITDAETRHAFLRYLADERFAVGVGEATKIERLVRARRGAVTAEQWKYVIAPVLARDAGEQQRFYDAYDLVFDPKLAPKDKAALEVSADLDVPHDTGLRPRRSVAKRSLWATAAIVPLLVLYFYFGSGVGKIIDSLPSRPQPTPAPDAPIAPGQQMESFTSDAPCDGVRCFTTPLAWLLAMPVVLWLVASLALSAPVARSVRTRVRESRRSPPFVWPLRGSAPLVSLGRLGTAVRMLRKRNTGDQFDLDVVESIRATARAAGFPSVRFLRRSREPEYLFLVEELAKHDHFAAWLRAIVERLQRGAVHAHLYAYRGDPRLCRPVRGQPVTLRTLASDFGGSRLIIAGSAGALLNPLSGEPRAWTATVRAEWPESVLLTPAASVDYGHAERVAARVMPVREFTLANLGTLPDLFDSPRCSGLRAAAFERFDYPLPPADLLANPADGAERLLAAFFPRSVFRWLCACAVHTHLEWEWTLALSALVSPGESPLTEEDLLLLVRLPWFRGGVIPGAWRRLLVRSLDPALAAAVRHALVRRIEDRAAPPGTYAADKQGLDLAAHRYWLEPNAERRATLERAIESMAPSDVQSDAMLAGLQQAWSARQSLSADETWVRLLWARFRGGAGLAKSALAIAATISVGVWLWSRSIETTQSRPVTRQPMNVTVTTNPDPAPTPRPDPNRVTTSVAATSPPRTPTTAPPSSVEVDPLADVIIEELTTAGVRAAEKEVPRPFTSRVSIGGDGPIRYYAAYVAGIPQSPTTDRRTVAAEETFESWQAFATWQSSLTARVATEVDGQLASDGDIAAAAKRFKAILQPEFAALSKLPPPDGAMKSGSQAGTGQAPVPPAATSDPGVIVGGAEFLTNPKLEMIDNRRVRLLEDLRFRDNAGLLWVAPAGYVSDGTSIPQAIWSVMGGPLEGAMVKASVMHDYHCEQRRRTFQQVNRMFYDALRASGVDEKKAKVLYAAVAQFGPRWPGRP